MFGSILIVIATVLHLYLFSRAASVPLFENQKRLLIAAAILLWVLFLSGRLVGHERTGAVAWWLEGRCDISGMTVIVSRGAGTWGSRMRLWHPGEILRVTLRSN